MTDHATTDNDMTDHDQPENGALVAVAKLTANRADDLIRQLQGLYLLADVIGTDGARTTSILVSAAIKGAVHEMREIEWDLSNLIRRLTTPESSSD